MERSKTPLDQEMFLSDILSSVTKLDTASLNNADLTVTCEATNNSLTKLSGFVKVTISDEISLKQKVSFLPVKKDLSHSHLRIIPELSIENPRIWWTHDLGKPELYDMKIEFVHAD